MAILQALAETAPAVAVYSGDGLTVRVLEWDEESGNVRGQIIKDGETFPFTGKHSETDDAEVVTGSFKVGDQAFKAAFKAWERKRTLISGTPGIRTRTAARVTTAAKPR